MLFKISIILMVAGCLYYACFGEYVAARAIMFIFALVIIAVAFVDFGVKVKKETDTEDTYGSKNLR